MQFFELSPNDDPTRPLFVPQDTIDLYDHLPNQNPTSVANFFPQKNKLLQSLLDDSSRSLYTSLIHRDDSSP